MAVLTDKDYEDNPFKPDFGGLPPALAGRKAEQVKLNTGLGQLQKGITPSTLIISAPRGMGKSVLLNKLEQDANKSGVAIRKTHAGNIKTLQQLTKWLAPDLVEQARAGSVGVGGQVLGVGVDLAGSRGAAFGEPEWAVMLEDLLLDRHKEVPLIICVDEAHTLTPEVARALGSLRHRMHDTQRPVWLLLAGTPGLEATLQAAQATFIERVTELSPMLLSAADAAEAVRTPLAERGWQVSEAALAALVADSDGYPYFLQLWGSEVWNAGVASDRAALDRETLARAAAAVNPRREKFYSHRYAELMRGPTAKPARGVDMVAVTLAVIQVMRRPAAVELLDLINAIKTCLPPATDPFLLYDYFEAKGFFWTGSSDRYVPGIPSLMDYVESKLAPPSP